MTKENLITAPSNTNLKQASEILKHHKIEKLPLVNENGILTGLITIKDIEKVVKYPNSAKDVSQTFSRCLCRNGNDTFERVDALVKAELMP